MHGAAHVEQPAQHRVAHRRGQWSPHRVRRRSPRQTGGGMQRYRPHRRSVEMALHFGDQRTTLGLDA